MSSLESLSYRNLQKLAKERGVRANGKKVEIIARLRKKENEITPPSKYEGKENEITPPSPPSKYEGKECDRDTDVKWFIDGDNKFAIGIELYEGGFPVVNGDRIRTYVKVYMRGMPHQNATGVACQFFYLSSGRNSSLGGVWLPSNIMSLRIDVSGKRKWNWYIQKRPWYTGGDGSDPANRFGGDPSVAMVSLILGGFSVPLEDGGDACAIDRVKTHVAKTLKRHLLKVLGKKEGKKVYGDMISYYDTMSGEINKYLRDRRKVERPCDDYDIDIWIKKCNSYNWFAPFDPNYPDYIPNLDPLDPASLWWEVHPSDKLFLSSAWLDNPRNTMRYVTLSKQEELGFPGAKTGLDKARMIAKLRTMRNLHHNIFRGELPENLASRKELLSRVKKCAPKKYSPRQSSPRQSSPSFSPEAELKKQRALEYRYKKIYGSFPPSTQSCEKCKKEVEIHQRVRIKGERLQYMKDLCIDCADTECKLYMGLTNLGIKATNEEECFRKLKRAEKVKSWWWRAQGVSGADIA